MEFNNKQLAVIHATESKILVEAAAASGKTACLVARIKYLLDNGIDPTKIVAITFTNNAAIEMLERLGNPDGLFIGTVHSYCNYLLRAGGVSTDKILNEDRFDDLFPLIKENPYCVKEIDHLIVDEAQDSTQLQFEFFELLSPKNFMYFFDLRQSIYGFAGAHPEYIIEMKQRPDITVYKMDMNYRNGTAILNYAKSIIKKAGFEFQDRSIPMRHIQGKFIRSELSFEGIANLLKKQDYYGNWLVLSRANKDVDTICYVLKKHNIPYDTFKQGDLNKNEIVERMKANTVKVLTIHSAKGLEADNVLVFNPAMYDENSYRLYYVAATRARDQLLWIKHKKENRKIKNWE